MAIDKNFYAASGGANPAGYAKEVTPADTDLDLATGFTRALYVGNAGNIVVKMAADDSIVTFVGVGAGSILPIRVSQVRAATTATAIVALY